MRCVSWRATSAGRSALMGEEFAENLGEEHSEDELEEIAHWVVRQGYKFYEDVSFEPELSRVTGVSRRRTAFEYRLQRRIPIKRDYLFYIRYELNLNALFLLSRLAARPIIILPVRSGCSTSSSPPVMTRNRPTRGPARRTAHRGRRPSGRTPRWRSRCASSAATARARRPTRAWCCGWSSA